jgi:hypothetical protein
LTRQLDAALFGADNLGILIDEHVVRPIDADVVDVVFADTEFDDTVSQDQTTPPNRQPSLELRPVLIRVLGERAVRFVWKALFKVTHGIAPLFVSSNECVSRFYGVRTTPVRSGYEYLANLLSPQPRFSRAEI